MFFNKLKENKIKDEEFNTLYPDCIKSLADTHFTPVRVSKAATKFLVKRKNTRILDIGSGVGKFCMIGSVCSAGYFVGVEQRRNLCILAKEIIQKFHLKNIEVINANILEINFKEFDAFYFYNSFLEYISTSDKIDEEVIFSNKLYSQYSNYVKDQLDMMPKGTRLVTYYGFLVEVPPAYTLIKSSYSKNLRFWQKTK